MNGSLLRFLTNPAVFWVLLAGWGAAAIYQKYRHPMPPQASRDLVVGQRIVAGDLQTDASKPLIGQVVRQKIAAGSDVTPDLLGPAPGWEAHGNTPAFVMNVPLAIRQTRSIEPGSAVAIVAGEKVLGLGRVLASDCAGETCALIITRDGTTPVEASALGGADVVLASTLSAAQKTPSPAPAPAPDVEVSSKPGSGDTGPLGSSVRRRRTATPGNRQR